MVFSDLIHSILVVYLIHSILVVYMQPLGWLQVEDLAAEFANSWV